MIFILKDNKRNVKNDTINELYIKDGKIGNCCTVSLYILFRMFVLVQKVAPPCESQQTYTVGHKKRAPFILSITLANIDGFS